MISDCMSEYFSDKDKIKELEIKLVAMTKKYKAELGYKSKYKLKFENLLGEKLPTRGQKALLLIKELKSTDRPGVLIRAIAKKCFLSENHVTDLWYKH